MSKQTNFKKIVIILGVLLVLLLVIKLKDRKQGDRSFKAYVLAIDTSEVNVIKITPKGSSDAIKIKKEGSIWMLHKDDAEVQADGEIIMDLLSQVALLKTKSVAATSKQKWADYEVTDSTGSRITLLNNKKELADFMLGKFSYSQPQGQAQNMQQQQNIIMTSYIRLFNENEVYAVDGYLSMMFNRDYNSFRENAVVVGNPDTWKKIIFSYPADSSFTLVNQNNKWMVNGLLADSMAIDSYFSKIRMLTDTNFDNEFKLSAAQQAEFNVRIEGDNFTPIEVNAYRNQAGELVFSSSQSKGSFIKSSAVREALFVNKQLFLSY